MKALTLYQPWATLVAAGAKRIETRSWKTTHRGPLAIHASRRFPGRTRALLWQEPFLTALMGIPGISAAALLLACGRDEILPLGRVIATCELVDCFRITAENAPPEPERSFGDYTPGRFAWVLADIRPLSRPWPQIKGCLGLWDLDLNLTDLLADDNRESSVQRGRP